MILRRAAPSERKQRRMRDAFRFLSDRSPGTDRSEQRTRRVSICGEKLLADVRSRRGRCASYLSTEVLTHSGKVSPVITTMALSPLLQNEVSGAPMAIARARRG